MNITIYTEIFQLWFRFFINGSLYIFFGKIK
jgi:hypothetical protein